MISRWCAAPEPEIWKFLGENESDDEDFPVSQHVRCAFERRQGHDEECHRQCCWGPDETESRDCTCPCHPSPESHQVLPEYADVPPETVGEPNRLESQ